MTMCYLVLSEATAINPRESTRTDAANPWRTDDNWRLNAARIHARTVIYQGEELDLTAEEIGTREQRRFKVKTPATTVDVDADLTGDQLKVTIEGEVFVADVGDEVFIPQDARHTVANAATGRTVWLFGYD